MGLFNKNAICLSLSAKDKPEAIEEMIGLLDASGALQDRKAFAAAIQAREAESTTGIGFGIAIPHAKSPAVREARVIFARSLPGVEYASEDGKATHLLFMIAAPDAEDNAHLKILARLLRKLSDPVYRNRLLACVKRTEVLELLESI